MTNPPVPLAIADRLIDGDGLDDLIVGVDQAYVNGKQRVGKSYVVFGKIDSTAINQSAIVNGTDIACAGD
jgi:hypothetical protein